MTVLDAALLLGILVSIIVLAYALARIPLSDKDHDE